jgi:DNA-binding CsgD family transcriptional regulator
MATTEFSPRERDVWELICAGQRTGAIAQTLGISPKTVETHRMRINKKLGTHSPREIILHRIIATGDAGGPAAARLEAVLEIARCGLSGRVVARS